MKWFSYNRLACLAAVLATTGCDQGPFSYVPVSGDVKYEDGSLIPAKSINLVFKSTATPVDEKIRPRPAQAGVNVADGTFGSVTSYKPGDGLVAGEHKVTVIAYGDDGQLSGAIPKEYANGATTPILVNTDERPFEIRVAKP